MVGKFKDNILILVKNIDLKDFFDNSYYKIKKDKITTFSSSFAIKDNNIIELKPGEYDINEFEKIVFTDNLNKNSFLERFIYKNKRFIYLNFILLNKAFKCRDFKTEFSEIKQAENFISDFLKDFKNVKKEQLLLVFNELFFNAYEHGNLGISFEEKESLLLKGKYFDYIKNQKSSKKIEVCINKFFYHSKEFLSVKISDEGKGFKFENKKPVYNGRGLLMSDKLCNGVFYNEKGNSVIFVKEVE